MSRLERVEILATDGSRIGKRSPTGGVVTRQRAEKEGRKVGVAVATLAYVGDLKDRYLIDMQRGQGAQLWIGRWLPAMIEHNEPGESYDRALYRGLDEELGIDEIDTNEIYGLSDRGKLEAELTIPIGGNKRAIVHARGYVVAVHDLDEMREYVKGLKSADREIAALNRKRIETARQEVNFARKIIGNVEPRTFTLSLLEKTGSVIDAYKRMRRGRGNRNRVA